MKRILIPFLALASTVSVAVAEMQTWYAYVADVSTNAAAIAADTVTSPVKFKGWIDAIIIDRTCAYSGATNTVTLATSGLTGAAAARTIYSETLTDTNTIVYPRQIAHDTSGSEVSTNVARIPVYGDKLVFTAYANTSTTGVTAKCFVFISDVP